MAIVFDLRLGMIINIWLKKKKGEIFFSRIWSFRKNVESKIVRTILW